MNRKEFGRRRRQLMRMIGDGGIAILPAAQLKKRNRDVEYRYRQDSDFYYLTGFAEPESVAVLIPGRGQAEYVLFCRERNPERETWDGSRAGPDGAITDFDADDAFPVDDIDDILPGLLETCDRVFYTMGSHPDFDQRLIEWVRKLRDRGGADTHSPQEFIALDHYLHDMRLFKSRSEVSAMRKAARIAVAAHERAMRSCKPGKWEYEIQAELLYEFARQGADISYQPIVGSGANACTLHYIENNRRMQDGELLLVDAGCEFDYYASDITRTYPVSGKFSAQQRVIYDIVLEANCAAIEQVRPGSHWNEPHDAAVKVITAGLRKIGLLKGGVKKLIKDEAYKKFFMHRTGHWLGMDVHDVGDYKVDDTWRLLESGMVMTIEPGIYIRPQSAGVPRKWWGIGVRIEDDVLVTRDGNETLSGGLAKNAADIEQLIGSA